MSIGFDTLRAADSLTQAGIAETHAKAIVSTMSNAIGEHVATKTDIAGVQGEIAGVQGKIAGVKGEIAGVKADIAAVRTEIAAVSTEIAAVRTEVAELKAALTWRIVLSLGAFAALMRMMP